MVKGTTRQVIVVQSPKCELFDQAIFILREDTSRKGVTEDDLMKEARKLMALPPKGRKFLHYAFWMLTGSVSIGLVWLLTVLF